MSLEKETPYARQMDDFLMHRLDRLEGAVDEMKGRFTAISAQLDKISEAQASSQPPIRMMKSVMDAGWLLKWSVSTIVVFCMSFAAVMTGWEALQKWLGK